MAFVHLHVHTEYSLLDGACRIKDVVHRAAELGQTALAITDHGVMYGAVDFYRAAKAEGIKPVIGCEVYMAPRSRFDREHGKDDQPRHLVLLCENETGYRNLSAMVSRGFTEGFYGKPRIDRELLEQHHEGLIALSGCLAGEIPRRLLARDYEAAKAYALEMQALFGEGNFYLELQDHGIPEQKEVIPGIIRIHQETGIPLAATNDAHYIRREDAAVQDVLLCIQTGRTLDEPGRMKFETQEFYLKSEDEMAALFPGLPEALANTAAIAERCNMEFVFGTYHLPEFPVPPEYESADALFTALCEEGFARRYPNAGEDYRRQLDYEMAMIRRMGFVEYFLIVADFIGYAKDHGIPVGPGRGSAAGSMVSYCMRITEVDPMRYALYFERFLNPERVSMPDIDVDFCYRRRGEVIDYVNRKYGADHVAQIVTFGTMLAKGAVRDVARVLDVPYGEADAIAKLVPNTLHITLEQAMQVSKPLREQYDADPTVRRVIDTARALEGMPRHASTHAAGVVITRNPVDTYVPLATNDEAVVTQYTMTTLEELGLLKMDFLALRNLTVLDDAVQLVRQQDPSFRLEDIPEDDPEVYQMLADGRTCGVFQMESGGITGVCVGLKPQNIEDITAIIALYRPGPMDSIPRFIACKHDPSRIRYAHSALEPILSVTYGCIVYQEQVIEIFRRLAGYSLGQADMVRRAISKKKAKEIEKEREAFLHGDPERGIDGCVARGIPEETAQEIYKDIYDFANYAFNKAHAVCYAIVAYQTAWFKRRHPQAYLAALLTSVLDSQNKIAVYIAECRAWNIRLLPPDVNQSGPDFSVAGEDIRFGLAALKGVGRAFTASLLAERERGGPFRSFTDFCQRMLEKELNKRVVESLIRAGAFDSMGVRRSQLLDAYEELLDNLVRNRRKNLAGQVDLFGGTGAEDEPEELMLRDIPEYPLQELLAMEKELTGLYLSGHPMDEYREVAARYGAVPVGQVTADFAEEGGPQRFRDGQKIVFAGVVTTMRTRATRSNTMMAYAEIEEDSGTIELIVFSRVLDESGSYLREGEAILAEGRLSVQDDKPPQMICDRISPLGSLPPDGPVRRQAVPAARPMGGQTLYVRLPGAAGPEFARLKGILQFFPGRDRLVVYFADTKQRRAAPCLIHDAFVAELRERFGEENVVVKG